MPAQQTRRKSLFYLHFHAKHHSIPGLESSHLPFPVPGHLGHFHSPGQATIYMA